MEEQLSRAFLDSLLSGRPGSGNEPGGLKALRARALERANALSVPTTRHEDWRFTDLSPLYRLSLNAPGTSVPLTVADITQHLVPGVAARCVFVDGHYRDDLSENGLGTEFVTVVRTGGEDRKVEPDVLDEIGRIATFDEDPFVAVNTAWLSEVLVIHLPRGACLTGPVHCLFVNTQADVVTHPRVLLVAESGSDVTLLEDFVTVHDRAYCVNAVSEIAVGANARVRHIRLQRESRSAFHVATGAVAVARDGRYESNAIATGARISRHNLHVRQDGEGAHFSLDGLAMIAGRQLADTHSFVDHALAHGTSRQLHKCVVSGGAHGVFNGRILVRPGAQLTDSSQESRNLLLSGKAQIDTKPQLEIFADDVKCAHGAAVGQLEPEEVFYLRSRGLPESLARSVLTYAFAADVVDRIPVPSVVDHLRAMILERTGIQELA
ncbi:MAG: Fe-S cluster assembly protein SufD [Betaproteobacteria bacterium]|nr:Fe-S cluster assembly protein SufD [Betaproteobacteria bacterium]